MRAAGLALVSALVAAGVLAVLAIRRRAMAWAEWEALDDVEPVEDIVPMAAWWPDVEAFLSRTSTRSEANA